MANFIDTFERSCDHWSESGRGEMEDFYALASVDYQHLAGAIDWKNWFEKRQKRIGPRSLQLLDVACGSGKFPMALNSHADITNAAIKPVKYSLLDPSSFSISEARQALSSPFKASAEYEMRLQDFRCCPGSFDIVWAIHALYAIPHNELEPALKRMVNAIGNDGIGFIAHASAKSHYLEFYQHYLTGFKGGVGEQYSSSEQIIEILNKIGVTLEIKEINYTNTAPQTKKRVVERYLQRCLFDDSLSLKDMLINPITGPYLESFYENDIWQFTQRVSIIFVNVSTDVVVE
jgi:ubiquinone/menaquinone biosynthesis C-methylase UbiE